MKKVAQVSKRRVRVVRKPVAWITVSRKVCTACGPTNRPGVLVRLTVRTKEGDELEFIPNPQQPEGMRWWMTHTVWGPEDAANCSCPNGLDAVRAVDGAVFEVFRTKRKEAPSA